jgi:hypothetical protein
MFVFEKTQTYTKRKTGEKKLTTKPHTKQTKEE